MPIINIITNDILCFGTDVMEGCVKGTLLFDLAYVAFCIGYFSRKESEAVCNKPFKHTTLYRKKDVIVLLSMGMWVFCFLCSIVYIMSSGLSLSYILSLGLSGNVNTNQLSETPLGFIGMKSDVACSDIA